MPVKLIIEEDQEEVFEKNDSICNEMEKLIPDDAMVICIKYNIPELKEDETFQQKVLENFMIEDILIYVGSMTEILFSSIGIHIKGKSQHPHVHFNLIVSKFEIKKVMSNPSQHRKRWCEKEGFDRDTIFKGVSFQFHEEMDKKKPKYFTLAYPLKEGRHLWNDDKSYYVFNKSQMIHSQFTFLLDIGTTIYNLQEGMHLRQEKSDERKKQSLLDLYQLCRNNTQHFNTYREMLIWLDHNYISKLEIHEFPDPKNYKTNCQKIAVQLKFLNYSQLCV